MIGVYVRVSSAAQDLRSQERDLKVWADGQEHPVHWYKDKATGTKMERPGLERLLADVRAGKIRKVVVWRLDRLGRAAKGLLDLFHEFERLKCTFLSLRDAIDLATPTGRLLLVVLAGVSAFETEVRQERQPNGIAAAREENGGRCPWGGRKPGTRVKVTVEKEQVIRTMHRQGLKIAAIARSTELTRKTVYAVLSRSEGDTTEESSLVPEVARPQI
jgi:DNA invertase Pin-like site-specific DNA recombinase